MSEYTPNTEWVGTAWSIAREKVDGAPTEISQPEFSRWLQAHDREVAAAALEEAAEKLYIPSEGPAYYVDVALAEQKAAEYLRSLAAQKRGA